MERSGQGESLDSWRQTFGYSAVELYLAPYEQVLDSLHVALPKEEQERSFYRRADRDRFLAARSLLRYRLSDSVQHTVPPDAWHFALGAHGKPYLDLTDLRGDAQGHSWQEIHFNLAHSAAYIALAFSLVHSVGVDLEWHKLRSNAMGIAVMLFTASEQKGLEKATDEGIRQDLFFRFWCRHEAQSKLQGTGLLARPQEVAPFCGEEGTFAVTHNPVRHQDAPEPERYHWALCWR